MARLFDDAASEYLGYTGALLSGVPLAMACWFFSDSLTIDQSAISITRSGTETNVFSLRIAGARAGDPIQAVTAGAQWKEASTTTSYLANTWQHACGIWGGVNDRRAFLGGGSKGIETTSQTPAGLDRTSVGRLTRLTPANYMSGMVAEAAIWDLSAWPGATDADKANNFETILPGLVKGFSPLCYPLGLVAYWPLIRGLNDKVGGYNLTASGTTVSSHPRIILPHEAI